VRRFLALAVLCAALPSVALAAAPKIASLDTAGYPTVRATVVTPKPVGTAPSVTENGRPVVGFRAVNLGREKSVMLLFDRSQSMVGQAIVDASAAARQFVGAKPDRDRIAVVAVGKKAVQLTGFSSNPAEADAALRTIEVDKIRGTALYDGILVSTQALAADLNPTRVLILLTDGQEVSSDASLEQAIAAAREAHVTVYPIGIESPSFRPGPLQRLAEKTGGRYVGASGTKDLKAIYTALAEELRRTWQLSYVTSARPGDRIAVEAAGAHAESIVPGARVVSRSEGSKLPEPLFKVGPVLLATIVGFLGLVATLFLMRAPVG
jgi:VWFA-related protein